MPEDRQEAASETLGSEDTEMTDESDQRDLSYVVDDSSSISIGQASSSPLIDTLDARELFDSWAESVIVVDP